MLWGKCGDFFVILMYKKISDGNSEIYSEK